MTVQTTGQEDDDRAVGQRQDRRMTMEQVNDNKEKMVTLRSGSVTAQRDDAKARGR